jgi:hypothetical protein
MSDPISFAAYRAVQPDRTLFSTSCLPHALPIERLMPAHRVLLAYWQERCGQIGAPQRCDIDPADLVHILPHVMLWEAESDGGYRCRRAGTEIDAAMGGCLKGAQLADLPCTLIDEALHEFDAVHDGRMASFAERTMGWRGRPHVFYRHLLLPVANEAGTVHQLIGVLTFHHVPDLIAA